MKINPKFFETKKERMTIIKKKLNILKVSWSYWDSMKFNQYQWKSMNNQMRIKWTLLMRRRLLSFIERSNGDTWAGTFVDDEMQGLGKYTFVGDGKMGSEYNTISVDVDRLTEYGCSLPARATWRSVWRMFMDMRIRERVRRGKWHQILVFVQV